MVSSDDFDGKATNLNGFYLHINFEQKSPKPAIVPNHMAWPLHLMTMVHSISPYIIRCNLQALKLWAKMQNFAFFVLYNVLHNINVHKYHQVSLQDLRFWLLPEVRDSHINWCLYKCFFLYTKFLNCCFHQLSNWSLHSSGVRALVL